MSDYCKPGYMSRWDALDIAECYGRVMEPKCPHCGAYHLRDAVSEKELEEAAKQYRDELAKAFPDMAKQRGWTK